MGAAVALPLFSGSSGGVDGTRKVEVVVIWQAKHLFVVHFFVKISSLLLHVKLSSSPRFPLKNVFEEFHCVPSRPYSFLCVLWVLWWWQKAFYVVFSIGCLTAQGARVTPKIQGVLHGEQNDDQNWGTVEAVFKGQGTNLKRMMWHSQSVLQKRQKF